MTEAIDRKTLAAFLAGLEENVRQLRLAVERTGGAERKLTEREFNFRRQARYLQLLLDHTEAPVPEKIAHELAEEAGVTPKGIHNWFKNLSPTKEPYLRLEDGHVSVTERGRARYEWLITKFLPRHKIDIW